MTTRSNGEVRDFGEALKAAITQTCGRSDFQVRAGSKEEGGGKDGRVGEGRRRPSIQHALTSATPFFSQPCDYKTEWRDIRPATAAVAESISFDVDSTSVGA